MSSIISRNVYLFLSNLELLKTLIAGRGTDATPHNYKFIDETAQIGSNYFYRIEDVDFSGKTHLSKIIEVTISKVLNVDFVPKTTALLQNYPNPFNPETWIPFALADPAEVSITIYDATGSLIRTFELGGLPAGIYVNKDKAVYWDGKNDAGEKVSSSMYFYTLRAGKFTATRRLVVVK